MSGMAVLLAAAGPSLRRPLERLASLAPRAMTRKSRVDEGETALGKGKPMSSLLISEASVLAALHEVYDPELGINVVDLGLVYDVEIDGPRVVVTMTLTTPGCPLHDSLTAAVDEAVHAFVPGVESVEVNLVWEPPWSPNLITEAGRRELGWFG